MRERLMRKSREEASPTRGVQPTHLLRAPRLQARLTLGPAGDEYEREAERIAEQLTGKAQRSAPQMRVDADRQPGGSVPVSSSELEAHLEGLRGGGQPLPEPVRSDLEPRFGHDFSRIRVHTSTRAAASAKALDAQAFTVGQDIVFAEGLFTPESEAGRRLLAHELTHVVQQSGPALAPKLSSGTPPGREADKVRRSPAPKEKAPATSGAGKAGQAPGLQEPGGATERSGKKWVGRFLPSTEVSDLKEPFQSNVQKFLAALSTARIRYRIRTTLRPPQRSYLMYYAREVATGRLAPDKVPAFVPQGNDAPVNIDWAHRDGKGVADLAAAKKAAAEMDSKYAAAQAIGKPYKSHHNRGEAIDMKFTPPWGIGKSVVDGNGKKVAITSKEDLITVGATYSVFHWNYSGPKSKKDNPHWSKTGS